MSDKQAKPDVSCVKKTDTEEKNKSLSDEDMKEGNAILYALRDYWLFHDSDVKIDYDS